MSEETPRYHVLLIGIDDYPTRPLRGCVNDIDVVQGLLLDRVGLPPEAITRLASPRAEAVHPTVVPSLPATLANVRAALAELASDRVGEGDRVLVYYSGHGARVPVLSDGQVFFREAIVPVDFQLGPGRQQLLFDHELNALLARIAARTRSVGVVLDCCHSTGVTREALDADACPARSLDAATDLGITAPLALPPGAPAGGARGIAAGGGVADCQVVAACLDDELARESTGPDGAAHGLFTRVLMDALGSVADADLAALPWGRVWPDVRAAVEAQNPSQHPWMSGSFARAVLAGPPVDGDLGLAIARTGDDTYAIGAGTLMGITVGARIAVYPELPLRFPPLGSADDVGSRVGEVELVVQSAERARAFAGADGAPFDLPKGARGRLVAPGEPERLRCAVLPPDPDVTAALRASPMLDVTDDPATAVRLERRGDAWVLCDDIHGTSADLPPLAVMLGPREIREARAVLEHYFYYALPIRFARMCGDLPGALELRFLACPAGKVFSPQEAQAPALAEVTAGTGFTYELAEGDLFAFRVRNTSTARLRVTLLNVASSGKVQVLGDQAIGGGASQMFWLAAQLGSPFEAQLPGAASQSIDRTVVVGTTNLGVSLATLALDATFADVVARMRGDDKDYGDPAQTSPPVERWTATQVTGRTRPRS